MLAKGLTSIAIAVASFIATGTIIRTLLPFPEIEPISSKMRYFQAHHEEIDTLFLGSSRVYQQISPALFDKEMRRNQTPTHAFNFGVNGMFLAEESYLLDQLLPRSGNRLRWVFIELEALPLGFDPNNMGSQRTGYWHDWTRMEAVSRKILRLDEHGKRKATRDILLGRKKGERRHHLFLLHLSLFARHFVNLGAARDIADWVIHHSNPPDVVELGPLGDGYRPGAAHLRADKAAGYETALSASTAVGRPKTVDRYTEDICRRCAETIRRHGAIPVFLVTPVIDQSNLIFADSAIAPGTILSFNNASRYPELYRAAVRIDYSHMNESGSAEFTRQLGREFTAALRKGTIK
ncbi:MAG: hypothetical protein ABIU29_01965 [Chthoniobacterales bacterium]